MFFARHSSSIGRVGVDFGAAGIRMLQVREVAANALEVVGAAWVAAPLPQVNPSPDKPADQIHEGDDASADASRIAAAKDELAERIRAAFAAGGFAGRNCVVTLARPDVHVQSIRLPKMPDDELRQTAAWEAAQRFGFDRDAIEVDFIRTGATLSGMENRDEIILIAAQRSVVQERLELLLNAGLRPIAVEPAFPALVRAFSRQFRRETDIALARVIVEIGASGSTVLVLRGDQIAFCKPLAIGGGMFNRAVAEQLQMSEDQARELRRVRINGQLAPASANTAGDSAPVDADPSIDRAVFAAIRPLMNELAKEITLCLRYYGVTFRGQAPQRLILTGGDALEPRLDEVVAKNCNLSVIYDDAPPVLSGLIGPIRAALHGGTSPAACWATALGASLRRIGVKRIEKRSKSSPQQAVAA